MDPGGSELARHRDLCALVNERFTDADADIQWAADGIRWGRGVLIEQLKASGMRSQRSDRRSSPRRTSKEHCDVGWRDRPRDRRSRQSAIGDDPDLVQIAARPGLLLVTLPAFRWCGRERHSRIRRPRGVSTTSPCAPTERSACFGNRKQVSGERFSAPISATLIPTLPRTWTPAAECP